MNDNKTTDEALKVKIIPEYSKEEFLRAAWIELANEDAPIEVFNEDFKEVRENEHQILIDSISVDVTYQVSVGYDRQEPYIAYETYYENEPYLTTESYYDTNTHSTRTRQVTKYKKVQKQRQVTKYKTVTDWNAINGNHHASSIATAENLPGQYLDKNLFISSFTTKNSDSTVLLDDEEFEQIKLNDSAHDDVMSEHRSKIYSSLYNSLPGDHTRELDYQIKDITEHTSTIYKTCEYEASVGFKGKNYTKKAFPFGSMAIGGDKIENTVSLESVTQKMKNELLLKIKDRKKQISENVWKSTKLVSIVNFILLYLSIMVSLFVRSTAAVITVFAVAFIFFAFNWVLVKRTTEDESKKAQKDIKAETDKTDSEIENYATNYKSRQKEALNKKLKSLGLEPASAEELKGFRPSLSESFE